MKKRLPVYKHHFRGGAYSGVISNRPWGWQRSKNLIFNGEKRVFSQNFINKKLYINTIAQHVIQHPQKCVSKKENGGLEKGTHAAVVKMC